MTRQSIQVQIKLTPIEKRIIEKAGDLFGIGHSTFIRQVVLERARDVLIKNGEVIKENS